MLVRKSILASGISFSTGGDVNRTITHLLGNRGLDKLVRQPFDRFVLGADKDIFYHHRGKLFSTVELQAGNLSFDFAFSLRSGRKKLTEARNCKEHHD
ncbi:hypothetical protein [Desulfocastanea catecholica]